jgi:hypothetical protein
MLGLILSFSAAIIAAQNSMIKCRSATKGGKYKKATITPSHREPDRVGGTVPVDPGKIDGIFLEQLARRLRSVYCRATFLEVAIYDSVERLEHGWEIYNQDKSRVRWRANYTLDRSARTETMELYNAGGDPKSKTFIDLTKTN